MRQSRRFGGTRGRVAGVFRPRGGHRELGWPRRGFLLASVRLRVVGAVGLRQLADDGVVEGGRVERQFAGQVGRQVGAFQEEQGQGGVEHRGGAVVAAAGSPGA